MDALWSSIDLIQCITLRERPERRAAAEHQFAAVGLAERVEFLEQERDAEDGKRGCFRAHQQAAAVALERGARRALTFEDDVVFLSHFTPHLAARAAAFLASDEAVLPWSVFFLGHFPRKMELVDGWSDVVRVRSMDGHAYVLTPAGARELCSLAYAGDQVDVHFHYRCERAFALYPMVAVQAAGASDTEGTQRADDWNDDKLRRERELYEGCVKREALARALGRNAAELSALGVLT
jgi:GR25 family glycosyltransferase involved in LPS biosynthesis